MDQQQSQTFCILGVAVGTLSGLFAAKQYFNGGTCKVNRNIQGLTVVFTGGNAGIGKQTIEELAKSKCRIIFGARDTKKSEKAIEDIRSRVKDANISQYGLDLGSKSSTKQFAEMVLGQVEKIDILINNAAVAIVTRQLTEDGFQMNMGVNHLGHFYLTSLLWAKIKIAPNPRIFTVSSIAHQGIGLKPANLPIQFQDFHFAHKYDALLAYASAKQGAQTSLYAVLEEQDKLVKGGYYSDCKLKATTAFTNDPENAQKLWKLSQKELEIQFEI